MYNPLVTNISNKYGNIRWKSKSLKIDREVFLYSDLEYDNWLKMVFSIEEDKNVENIKDEQVVEFVDEIVE
ncbi:hypothetical protein [Lysinibacillus fusiformis]|uniref:hypothetical protein n=1 Tax=Lysinibacillus fusiformis TaxID=28031 RepID=UPI0020BEED54|nr:hypothetical protein [Lysinibacillus fusiformis]